MLTVPLHAPLVSLDTVAAVLNISREDGKQLVECGNLFAFDLSLERRRPLIRVWSQSLFDYSTRRCAPTRAPEVVEILSQIFPVHGETMRASYIAKRLAVDCEHIGNLLKAGILKAATGEMKPGPGGSPKVIFASLAALMEARAL